MISMRVHFDAAITSLDKINNHRISIRENARILLATIEARLSVWKRLHTFHA